MEKPLQLRLYFLILTPDICQSSSAWMIRIMIMAEQVPALDTPMDLNGDGNDLQLNPKQGQNPGCEFKMNY